MIYEVTYRSHKIEREINLKVGKAFSFFERLKMRGIGSGRLRIKDSSEEIKALITKTSDTAYSNIELRPKGIIVGIKSIHRTFHWVIPYFQLTLYKNSGHISVYDNKHKMNLIYEPKDQTILDFLKKVMDGKASSRSYPE